MLIYTIFQMLSHFQKINIIYLLSTYIHTYKLLNINNKIQIIKYITLNLFNLMLFIYLILLNCNEIHQITFTNKVYKNMSDPKQLLKQIIQVCIIYKFFNMLYYNNYFLGCSIIVENV